MLTRSASAAGRRRLPPRLRLGAAGPGGSPGARRGRRGGGRGGGGQVRPHGGFDPESAELDPAAGGAALEAAFAVCAARGVEAHGMWSAGDSTAAVASRAGAHASDRTTDAFMKVTVFGPGGRSGYSETTAAALGAINPRALAERAAQKAAFGGAPAMLPPGEYPVVLESDAVGVLASWLG